ncbi:MAG: hypothetical protein IKX30_15120, partial [Victivallales bacterium]|nr:hypothetical protein [Victivallales bacterium]
MARTAKFACPCCGRKRIEKLGDYEICDVCGWEDDPTQSKDPDFAVLGIVQRILQQRRGEAAAAAAVFKNGVDAFAGGDRRHRGLHFKMERIDVFPRQ